MSTTLAAKYLSGKYVTDDFAISQDEDGVRVTLQGAFGQLCIAEAADAGTLIGELALVSQAAATIAAQIEGEADFPAYAFMVWLNGMPGGSFGLGSGSLRLINPDYGTRRALGSMALVIVGPHFRFTTDAYNGLGNILAFVHAVYGAAFLADRWLETRYKYVSEVPAVITAQADKIALYGSGEERAAFGLRLAPSSGKLINAEDRNDFAEAVTALLKSCREWGSAGEGNNLGVAHVSFVRLKTEYLPNLLQSVGNTLAAHPANTLALLNEQEAQALGCPT